MLEGSGASDAEAMVIRTRTVAAASKSSRGLRLVLGAALLALTLAPLADAGVGPNATCAHGGNDSGTACVNGKNGERYLGGYDNFRNVSLTASGASSSNPIHINQEMWFY